MAMKRTRSGEFKRYAKRFKKRSYKRRFRSKNGASFRNSNAGTFFGSGYKSRKLPYRKYKNEIYRSLKGQEAYRSAISQAQTYTTPTIASNQKVWVALVLPPNFHEALGGYTGTGTFSTDKFTIKGGVRYLTIRNANANAARVEAMLVRFKQPNTISGTVVNSAFDVSNIAGFGQTFVLASTIRKTLLEVGDICQFTFKIPFTVINNYTRWAAEDGRLCLLWSVYPVGQANTHSHIYEAGHNLTFTGELIA